MVGVNDIEFSGDDGYQVVTIPEAQQIEIHRGDIIGILAQGDGQPIAYNFGICEGDSLSTTIRKRTRRGFTPPLGRPQQFRRSRRRVCRKYLYSAFVEEL